MIAAVQQRLCWRTATVIEIRSETPSTVTLGLSVPGWPEHVAGQHLDLKLTAPDGYEAQRNYSIASAPSGANIEITVEQVASGEVSSFLVGEASVGDTFEVRGPIGGYFTWEPAEGGPLMLVAGGSGIVPLMAILRRRSKAGDRVPVRLIYSSRTYGTLIYRSELDAMAAADGCVALTYTLTREQPANWMGGRRRVDRPMLEALGFPGSANPRAFVCGPTPFVEQVATDLLALGYAEARVKTERFGPTGAGHDAGP